MKRALFLGAILLAHLRQAGAADDWVPWDPPRDDFRNSPIDLRFLNETYAGEHGFIRARGEQFIHEKTGEPVRFWAVNGPPENLGSHDLNYAARLLAKHGVNLVRIHSPVFDGRTGKFRPQSLARIREAVAALKAQGIYSHLSIYFPLWLTPENGTGWREGYDGRKHPFALLLFEPEFQELYRNWWRAILTSPNPDGQTLLADPALMGVEIQNEDSFLFWTFQEKNIPDPQLRKLEALFGGWAGRKYGSLEKALAAWGAPPLARDNPKEGRLAFRPLSEMFGRRSARDRDTAVFLLETQRGFYENTVRFLRGLGYQGLITASNWTTANNAILGPLEKFSYAAGDFLDRHGYFGCNHRGENAAWSIRSGHTYSDRSALRLEAAKPGGPPEFEHPVMDLMINFMPSMISETTWNRPNRHRAEAPLFLAAYGALQDTDGIVHFSLDGIDWRVKPRFHMQPWTLMSPSQIGQFPAAALVYRKNLLKTGDLMADLPLKIEDAGALRGSPFSLPAELDELRRADVPGDASPASGAGIDPLVHFVGRTNLALGETAARRETKDLRPFIDRAAKTIASSTGELRLDYGRGVLAINAPQAQGASGNLQAAGPVVLRDLTVSSDLDLIHIAAVALDGRPLDSSSKILLQVMTEEKPTGFAALPAGPGILRIEDIGRDPWLIRSPQGVVKFRRPDAARLSVTALDFNGYPAGDAGTAEEIKLRPATAYYLIEKRGG